MASSRSAEVSLILPGMANSLFTHYILEALRGRASNQGDGLIRVFDVFSFVPAPVPTRANQHPVFKATDVENNFPMALYLGGEKVSGVDEHTLPDLEIDKRKLRDVMSKQFSLPELELLCSDIQQDLLGDGHDFAVSLELVGGSGKLNQIFQLIEYLDRRHYLQYLVTVVRRERPGSV